MLNVNLQVKKNDFQLKIKDFILKPNEIVSIYGKSGSGKTTFLRFIAGFDKYQHGTIILDKLDITQTHPFERNIVYLCQKAYLFYHLSIKQNINFNTKEKQYSNFLLEKFDVQYLLKRPIQSISNGEKQIIAIIRAIATRPKILLIDEATSAIDVSKRYKILCFLKSIKIPIIYVSHNESDAKNFADRTVLF